jgi:Ricin-type beta-trefoil lectin domain
VTDPKEDARAIGGASGAPAGGVSNNAFSGPAGVQSGDGNTQINYYAAPSAAPANLQPLPAPPGTGGRGMRRAAVALGGLLVAGAVGWALVTQTPGEPSEPQPGGPKEPVKGNITAAGNDKLCVDVKGGADKRSQVHMWRCNATPSQVWKWHGKELRTFTRCLEVKNGYTNPGAEAYFFDCSSKPLQEWEWTRDHKLRNVKSGLCLGYPGPGAPAVPLAVYDCKNDKAKRWEHH